MRRVQPVEEHACRGRRAGSATPYNLTAQCKGECQLGELADQTCGKIAWTGKHLTATPQQEFCQIR